MAFVVHPTTPLLFLSKQGERNKFFYDGDIVDTFSSTSTTTSISATSFGTDLPNNEDNNENNMNNSTNNNTNVIMNNNNNNSNIDDNVPKSLTLDIPLLICFALFFAGNYFYSVTNKLAIRAASSTAASGGEGFPLTIAAVQLGLGSLYGSSLWLGWRRKPKISFMDFIKMIPVALSSSGSHSASVFGYAHGSVSFVQIVKAAEPAFAAVVSQFLYGKRVSVAKWLCLPVIIGGVVLASVSELNFAWAALASACLANLIASFRGNETKRLLDAPGLSERIGGPGNQFALTAILGFCLFAPVAFLYEGSRWGNFWTLVQSNADLRKNLAVSAFCYYGYNELRTVTLKKTSAVTGSVANTTKRLIVIIGAALALGESMSPMKVLGCLVGVGGVFVYSVIDNIFQRNR